MNDKIRKICVTALGIALYVAVSMILKIPVVGHISLDLGYIVLAVFCYLYGGVQGAIVGAAGCTLVSLLASGWFPIGWLLGNAFIGWFCGTPLSDFRNINWKSMAWCAASVFIGVFVIKTTVECLLYNIPLIVKMPKNAIAAAMDAVVFCVGLTLAPRIERITKVKRRCSYEIL